MLILHALSHHTVLKQQLEKAMRPLAVCDDMTSLPTLVRANNGDAEWQRFTLEYF